MKNHAMIAPQKVDETLLLKITGKLDTLSSQESERTIHHYIDQGETKLLLDFSEVHYLSSAGMRMLLSVYKRIRRLSGRLAICSTNDGVSNVLQISGFNELFDLFSTREEALKALNS